MNQKKTAGAASGLAVLLLAAMLPAADAAEEDTTPPELVSFEVRPSLIDARQGGTVTATMHITDATCLDAYDPKVLLSDAMGDAHDGPDWAGPVSGDCQDGVYEVSFEIAAHEPGSLPLGGWDATIYPLSDTLGNSAALYHPSYFGQRYFTYATPPGAVSDLQVTSTDATAIAASWTAPAANGSPITEYVVDIKDVSGATAYSTRVSGPSVDNVAAPLINGHSYSFESTAHNDVGGSETSRTTFVARSTVVAPEAVVFTDEDGSAADTYTIPATEGVEYLVGGEVVAPGTHPGAGTVEVAARAMADYFLAPGATTSWSATFSTETTEYTPPADSPFTDVDSTSTFYREIAWMAETGISGGWFTAAGKEYRPHTAVDRDVMAAFLYRMAGSPAYTAPDTSPFVDVTPQHAFYKEMAWMADTNISGGWDFGDGKKEYRPHTAVDRDVMAAFLHRMAGSPEHTAPDTSPFTDVTPQSTFYREIAWMADKGISGGWSTAAGKEYRPRLAVDRDVMAAFLFRLDGVL